MIATHFLPWQTAFAQHWLATRSQGRFSHAWLINGQAGIGKRHFALATAAAMLCESPSPQSGFACGECLACGWLKQGNHPDFMRVRPDAVAAKEGEEDRLVDEAPEQAHAAPSSGGTEESSPSTTKKKSEDIRIDQIRSLEPWYNRATHRGGDRIAVIYPAESLKIFSGNALLKALEEPPPHTIFLLVVDSPDALLPTIVSRCRRLTLPTPTPSQSMGWLAEQGVEQPELWLALSGGAPIKAQELAQQGGEACPEWLVTLLTQLSRQQVPDVGRMADELSGLSTSQWLDILQRVSIDLSWLSNDLPVRYFPQVNDLLMRLVKLSTAPAWVSLSHWYTEQMRLAHHPLNAKLFAHHCLDRICIVAKSNGAVSR